MRIPNIHTTSSLSVGMEVALDDVAAQHIGRVLRMKSGQRIRLFNGDGHYYQSSITEVSKKKVAVQVETCTPNASESPLHTHLGQVISRGDRMDYVVQKAVELGVNCITPLFSERCEVKLSGERLSKRLAHWQQVAISACEQSGRSVVPTINPAQALSDWLGSGDTEDALKLVLHHRDTQNLSTISPAPEAVRLLIGPEVGLSADEIKQAEASGFIASTFGPRVMRTETAPIAALTLLQWLWGDFND